MEFTQIFLPIAGSFAVTIMIMPLFIGYFLIKKQGQSIREDGPKWHNSKAGTPTMGGVVFLFAILIITLLASFWKNLLTPSVIILLFVMVLYGLLGFFDDFIKIFKKRNLGLRSWQKLLGQIAGGLIFYSVYHKEGFADNLYLPGIGSIHLGIFYGLFVLLWLVGFSNAVNLTDGLDGLVAGLGTISFAAYAVIAWYQQQYDILLVCLTVIGGLLGFFPFNRKPAKIFMGDVGSLALGGLLAAVSILLHQEWTLLLIGFVYVVETASVIIQVASFKLTGKRVFKMAPIHHHFEMCGWSEWKVDLVFWLVGLLTAGLALWISL